MDGLLYGPTRRSRTWSESTAIVLVFFLLPLVSWADGPPPRLAQKPMSAAQPVRLGPRSDFDASTVSTQRSTSADQHQGLKRLPDTHQSLVLAAPSARDGPPVTSEASIPEPLDLSNATPGPTWWDSAVRQPFRAPERPKPIELEEVLLSALSHSAQIRVLQEIPLIRETSVQEAEAEFDWVTFLESQWIDTSEPVGNRLTTGGPTRFHDEYLSASAGIRRRNQVGGRFEIAQQFGHQQNNSYFFDPPNQGTSRLTLRYTQPILRGAGHEYNTSLILLAETDTAASHDELTAQLQLHLLDVTRAYWGLYLERGLLLQKHRFYTDAAAVLQNLERRSNIDALQSQIIRARAAVESRRADVLRAEMAVRNSESRIRSLVNDPALGDSNHDELVPQLPPRQERVDLDIVKAVESALQNRPEVAQAVKQIQAASVRLEYARHELLPALNLVLESYVAGLRGSSDVGAAWVDQYREGEPSYSIGLQYERPFGNRASQARVQRRQHELRQLQAELQNVLEAIRLEVEVSVREVQTTYGEMVANYRAMEAAVVEVEYLEDRWQLLPDSDRSAALLLDALLQAQERLNLAESAYLRAQLNYNLSQMSYRKSIGALLQADGS